MIYLSGPITDNPGYISDFQEAEKAVSEKWPGETIFNPCNVTGPTTWAGYMEEDLKFLFKSDKIVFLPGYIRSKGCNIEARIAEGMRIERYYCSKDGVIKPL